MSGSAARRRTDILLSVALPLNGRLRAVRGWRADLVALASGGLSALALPPLFGLPALLIGIPVLLCLIQGAPRPAVAARRGWWFGFGLHLVGLYWITEAILFEAERFWWLVPFAVPALAAVLAIFIAVPAAVTWFARSGTAETGRGQPASAARPSARSGIAVSWPVSTGAAAAGDYPSDPPETGALPCGPAVTGQCGTSWRTPVTLAGAWVLADLARQFVATGFPWNPLGSVWEFPGRLGDIMIQPASLVGAHGLTLATILLASLPAFGWRWRIGGVAVLALWVGFGLIRIDQPMPPGPDLSVLLVQGNVEQGQKWDQPLAVAIFRRYLALTRQAVAETDGRPAVVVWPETASPALLQTDSQARELIAEAANGAPALIGSVRFDAALRPRNSLFALGPHGLIEAIYDKWHLVPFGEYQPDWLPLGIQIVPGGGFARGPGPQTLHIPGLPSVGVLICYEAIFPSQIINPADRPLWTVNVTNDAWFGNSAGPRQHLAAARLRAVEEGLPLLRAANTGISAGFDGKGHELGRLELGVTGFLRLKLPAQLPAPVYARTGLLLPGGVAFALMITGLARKRRN